MGQIQDLQKRAWQTKVKQGFNTTNVDREFNYTYAELAEAYDAHRKQKGTVGEELADTAIFLMGLSEMLGVNLEAEILAKMKTNETRKYAKEHGHHIKIKEES
jgi:NTP pyrophosphatase (non-canonical NTP hydrolase)